MKYSEIKKKWRAVSALFAFLCILTTGNTWIPASAETPGRVSAQMAGAFFREVQTQEMEEILPSQLYAQSAVLMDADTGRILFAKSGQEERPMASTTKIMTCILALELGNPEDEVTASANAAAQPAVKQGMSQGQRFLLKDLLFSLMLESHNDSAVAIAEHIGGSVEGFAEKMNQKAKEIGCMYTYFITPNGLDAEDENGIHHTTAEDLARIMRYCIMQSGEKEMFLEITRTSSYSFSDCDGNGNYSCTNHNAFLNMMEGALSGKTGFTADAGYCYVGTLSQDKRTFIVALLACGWPNNKGYKWADTRKLMEYGLENYSYKEIDAESGQFQIPVPGGFSGGFPDMEGTELHVTTRSEPFRLLLKSGEDVRVDYELPEELEAPVKEGTRVGTVVYSIDGIRLREYPAVAAETVEERTLDVCVKYIEESFLL